MFGFFGSFPEKTQILNTPQVQFLSKITEILLNNILLLSMNSKKIVCLRCEIF